MKYDTTIYHGIEFNLGNGEYHSLSFSTMPDKLGVSVNKEYLFLYKYEDSSFNNPKISFERKKESAFKTINKSFIREEKDLDEEKKNYLPLIKSKRDTLRSNEGISFNVPNTCGAESLDSTFFVDDFEPPRGIYVNVQKFAAQYDKKLQENDAEKHIAYLPSDIFKFDQERLKDKEDGKMPISFNKDFAIELDHTNLFFNDYTKNLNNKSPELIKEDLIAAKTEKTNLHEVESEYFVDINVPHIFKLEDIKAELRDRYLYNDNTSYLLDNSDPNIFTHDYKRVQNGVNNGIKVSDEWRMVGQQSNEIEYIQEWVGIDIDLGARKIIFDDDKSPGKR
jgi:hypothetical protein